MADTAATAPPGLDPVPADLQARLTAGNEAWRDRRPDALATLQAALADAEARGSLYGVIQAEHHLANLMFNLGRDSESARLHAEVEDKGRALDLGVMVGTSLVGLAHIDVVQGRLAAARERYDQAIALYEAAGQSAVAETIRRTLRYVDGLEAGGRLGEAFAHLRWAA
jgi:hypothetical protein